MSIGAFRITGGVIQKLKSDLFVVEEYTPDEFQRVSVFGTPVFSNLEIEPFNYETLEGETIEIKTGVRIDTVLFTVTQSKNIVKTPVQGRPGTVKEYISDNDYAIDVQGAIVGETNNFPEQDVKEFIEICKAPIAIDFISEFLNLFGITSVVIEEYNFPQREGSRNIQEFTLRCVSDTPIELDEFSIE
jgi:hypothetical protein